MITPNTEKDSGEEHYMGGIQSSVAQGPDEPPFTLTKNTGNDQQPNHQLLLRNKFIPHHTKAGINPLVDAASYLFSIVGKLKTLTSYHALQQLHKELISEINIFQENAKAHNYSSEYILVSRYAICATLDDIISNTAWGGQGQWENYSLLNVFNQESTKQERFFLILERIIKDPALYIDVMEFMYLCLSLGYKGSYRSTEFTGHQLEKITHSLYKRIRAFHGEVSKTLSSFIIKPPAPTKPNTSNISLWFTFLITACIIMVLFIGLGYMLDTISNQAYQALMQIGKLTPYEIHNIEHI
ncbi:MAG: type IVB secretion system protein IcmH/DotU [Gammaproteobacteria bacterium]|nr:type IVB secretion system protein IcmH/DotU [Gammaproteobacteria bacterium]